MSDVNLDNYVDLATATENKDFNGIAERLQNETVMRLLHAAIGMCTEAGEFQDALKKFVFYNAERDGYNLIEELGDMMWYIAVACDALDVTLQSVMQKNIDKLRKRYPEKFKEQDAVARDLDRERRVLEGRDGR